jgi:hypothetical protein
MAARTGCLQPPGKTPACLRHIRGAPWQAMIAPGTMRPAIPLLPAARVRVIIGMYAGILISVLEKTISMGNICAALTQSECLISLRSSVS